MEKQDLSNWIPVPTEAIIEYIENHFHARLRELIPQASQAFNDVLDHFGDTRPELKTCASIYSEFACRMPLHLLKEEQVLFPLLKSSRQPLSDPHWNELQLPLTLMQEEHEEDLAIFARLRKLTQGYELKDDPTGLLSQLFALLQKMEADLKFHIALENEIIFKRSRKLAALDEKK